MWINRQDLLYSLRSARPGAGTLDHCRRCRALGIGVNAGVFTLLNALWLAPRTEKDPVFGIAAVLLVVVSLLAMFLPAFRATQVDPMRALRTE